MTGDWTPVPALVGVKRPDLVLINDDDLTYAKIRLDPHSLRTAVSSIGSFTSSLPAALVWAATWDMVRDGEMAARDYVRLVLGGVDSVRDISVVQTLLRQATAAARQYADPSWRAEGLAFIASVATVAARGGAGRLRPSARLRPRARAPWRPRRMTWSSWPGCSTARSASTGSRSTPTCAGRCCGAWSAGARAARRRSTRSCRGTPRTPASGRRPAAGPRSRRSHAKRETWETLTDGKLTIAMFRATIIGFADPDQPALVQPYRPEYFAALGEVWRDWSSAMAQDFVEYGYSIGAVDESTIEATDAYLASSPEPPAALRRLLVEGSDEVARALRNQFRDREAAQG